MAHRKHIDSGLLDPFNFKKSRDALRPCAPIWITLEGKWDVERREWTWSKHGNFNFEITYREALRSLRELREGHPDRKYKLIKFVPSSGKTKR